LEYVYTRSSYVKCILYSFCVSEITTKGNRVVHQSFPFIVRILASTVFSQLLYSDHKSLSFSWGNLLQVKKNKSIK